MEREEEGVMQRARKGLHSNYHRMPIRYRQYKRRNQSRPSQLRSKYITDSNPTWARLPSHGEVSSNQGRAVFLKVLGLVFFINVMIRLRYAHAIPNDTTQLDELRFATTTRHDNDNKRGLAESQSPFY